MLSNNNMATAVPVKDLARAKAFYEKLGFKPADTADDGSLFYKSGNNSMFFVYESKFAGTNKATLAGWNVDDVAAEVEELKKLGVKFEHYDFPGVTREGDVHVMGEIKAAWFKDTEGNILSINEM